MSDQQSVKIFISHHSSKYGVAEQIEALLVKRGIQCWIAPRDVPPGAQFDTAVHNAIEDSSAILLLFCSNSDKSRHVKRELILGDSAGRPIIPLRLEAIDPGELAYHLADSQWIDWIDRREAVIERVAAQARLYANAPPELAGDATMLGAAGADEAAGGAKRNWIYGGLAAAVIAVLAIMLLVTALRGDDQASQTLALPQAGEAEVELAEAGAEEVSADSQLQGSEESDAETSQAAASAPAATVVAAPASAPPPAAQRAIAAPAPERSVEGPLQRVVQACAGVPSDTEYLICSNPDLGQRARAMSELIAQVRSHYESTGEDPRQFNTGQRQWMNGVKASCHSAACVEARQVERVEELRAITASLG